MTFVAHIALLGLIFKNTDLVAELMLQYLRLHQRTSNIRITNLQPTPLNKQNRWKINILPLFNILNMVNFELRALFNFVLMTLNFNNCEHRRIIWIGKLF